MLKPGTKLGPYEVIAPLGAGGMGEVYRARDQRLERDVAIKVLPAHLSSDQQLHARFKSEAKSLSALQHPNICVVYDVGTQDGLDFMVMEYVSGQTLAELIPSGGLPTDVALKYAVQIAEALSRAHAVGIVHRDLKPSNIMVSDNGLVKVLDFGLAKLVNPLSAAESDAATMAAGTVATTPGMVVGTMAYMSPEQAEARITDARSDIFAFGAVLYEMLTGKRAFSARSNAALLSAIMRDDPPPLSEVKRVVPGQVRQIVARCLQKDPARRYAAGGELAAELNHCRDLLFPSSGGVSAAQVARRVQRPGVLVPLLVFVVLMLAGAGWLMWHMRETRWAREVALPQIAQLADQGKYGDAYALALRAEKSIAGDRALEASWPAISYHMTIDTAPAGADVYRRTYGDPNASWVLVGRTPLSAIRQPRGMFLWRLEKPGYGTVLRTTQALIGRVFGIPEPVEGHVQLDETANLPPGMVRVSPAQYPMTLFIPGYEGFPELALNDYWIDRFEVTNRQFKAFLDQGGYQKKQYWVNAFQRDGKTLSWDDAMSLFRDSAGRPGPKDWIQGEYPKGQDDFPVTGISWYEAAAYAEFNGKSLPTIYHWNRAAGPSAAAFVVPSSNFGSGGVLPVGSKPGIGPWGTYDMAGNVKEWIATEPVPGKRYVLGGAWDEPNYMFVDPDAQSPFLRTSNIGFRCVKYIDRAAIPASAFERVPTPVRDFAKEKPVSEELFRAYRDLYSYDKAPLKAVVERGHDEEDWTTEKVTYAAPYGNERAILYLFLPKRSRPPFQTVIFFPGSNALELRTFSMYPTSALDAVLRSGRAVLYPVYKGTYERGDGMESDVPNMSSNWREHVNMWVKDASRAIDYADTRPELDHDKLAYYGYSWGAAMGAIVPAVEPRIKICVLALGGLEFQKSLPEVEPINFLAHVKQPVLMLNGRYDFFFPIASNQEPFYQMLGTKKEQKKHLIYETGHSIPRNELIKETLNWLDQHFGPVN